MQNYQIHHFESLLTEKLSHFGLNPSDWALRPIGRTRYFIEHKTERGFQFLGEIKSADKNTFDWLRIQLISI